MQLNLCKLTVCELGSEVLQKCCLYGTLCSITPRVSTFCHLLAPGHLTGPALLAWHLREPSRIQGPRSAQHEPSLPPPLQEAWHRPRNQCQTLLYLRDQPITCTEQVLIQGLRLGEMRLYHHLCLLHDTYLQARPLSEPSP